MIFFLHNQAIFIAKQFSKFFYVFCCKVFWLATGFLLTSTIAPFSLASKSFCSTGGKYQNVSQCVSISSDRTRITNTCNQSIHFYYCYNEYGHYKGDKKYTCAFSGGKPTQFIGIGAGRTTTIEKAIKYWAHVCR